MFNSYDDSVRLKKTFLLSKRKTVHPNLDLKLYNGHNQFSIDREGKDVSMDFMVR